MHDILSCRYVVLLISAPFEKKKLFRLVSSQANRFCASEIMTLMKCDAHNLCIIELEKGSQASPMKWKND